MHTRGTHVKRMHESFIGFFVAFVALPLKR